MMFHSDIYNLAVNMECNILTRNEFQCRRFFEGLVSKSSKLLIFLSFAALGGCETTASTPDNTAMAARVPVDYREKASAYLRRTLKDPYSVRDAQITEPAVIFVGLVNGGTAPGVCVQMNAKNSFGAYTGIQVTAVVFRDGQVIAAIPPVFDTCTKSTWLPFPEMNGAG